MKKIFCIVVASIFVFSCIGYTWAKNIEKNEAQTTGMTYHRAQLEDKPIILVFYVDWCTYCKKLIPKMKLLDAVYQNAYNLVFINCENPENKQLVDDYYITVYPTVYIVDERIQNRIHIDSGYYDDINLLKRELDRYLIVRKLIK